MKKFRLPRKEKKLYHRLDFMGKKCAKGYYSYFEYSQAGYNMLKAVRRETQRYKNSLWGTSYVDADKLTPYMEGDGLQLVRVVTLSSRPFGYLVRIDSTHNVKADDFDIEIMLDRIEEHYGCSDYDDYEEMDVNGKSVYVHNEDIDDDGNIIEGADILEDLPFCWDGGSWHTLALTKVDHLKTLNKILEEIQKAISEDFYGAYRLCHFIDEYSPTNTAKEIYRLIKLATGIDLDNVSSQWNYFYDSDFENKLEYLKAHYQPRIEIIKQTINYLETKTNRLAL